MTRRPSTAIASWFICDILLVLSGGKESASLLSNGGDGLPVPLVEARAKYVDGEPENEENCSSETVMPSVANTDVAELVEDGDCIAARALPIFTASSSLLIVIPNDTLIDNSKLHSINSGQ